MYYKINQEEALKLQKVNQRTGLTQQQLLQRQGVYGKNKLEEQKKKPLWVKILEQLADPMVLILFVAAAVSFITEYLAGNMDFVDPAIILLIVFVNSAIGIFQESKAEKALESLKAMLAPSVTVRRDGSTVKIPAENLLPGDIILLQAGDMVPADCRILESVALTVDESPLTGESHPSEKNGDCPLPEDTPLGDRCNMLWSSTLVLTGHGEAMVTAIGMETEVGKIAGMLISDEAPPTPLQQKLAKTGESLGVAALVICAAVFAVGVLRQIPAADMFLTSVSLAVAAIPEGLPAIVTIMLALGVRKMADNHAIVRKLPAVETLGCASVICSDKTGTLTQNKMTVTRVWGKEDLLYPFGLLCNNLSGPTEIALAKAAERQGYEKKTLENAYPRIDEIPFDSGKKWMATLHRSKEEEELGGFKKLRLIVKGAPDVIVELCQLTNEEKGEILKENSNMAGKALRVIAFAYVDFTKEEEGAFRLDEKALPPLAFAGLMGMIDPPRPEVKEAIRTCKEAGIKVVMITGDHKETASAIAREIGILSEGDKVMTGPELSLLSDDKLEAVIGDCAVFARVSPQHKVRIVKAFQAKGAVVSMTGDGVNDAPALKAADIGCAMGQSGTEVAKGAADMVLADDNFATIVYAVSEGREIYDNIRKAIHFLLSSNIGEIITIFVAILLGWQSPLLAVQLLWVNLVTDSFPAIALGVERADQDIMRRPPVSRKKGLFSDGLSFDILIEGAMIGTLALSAFSIGYHGYGDLTVGRTMAFCVLSLSQIIHALNMRSERSLFQIGFFSNRWLNGALILCGFLQISVVSIPILADVFKVVPLTSQQWGFVAAFALIPLLFVELEKFLGQRR